MTHPIIACARGYIGTRFQHQGRLKKTEKHRGGIDCLGLLLGVAQELDLRGNNGVPITKFDIRNYSHQPDAHALRLTLKALLLPIALDEIMPADIALFAVDGAAQHLGIISEVGIIHAYAPAKSVVEHALDAYWEDKMVAAFRLPPINH